MERHTRRVSATLELTRAGEGIVSVRAPLRITLAGGGTDLPSYYRVDGGFVVSATIDRHIQMLAGRPIEPGICLKHLELEECAEPAEVRHPILRAALERHWDGGPLELASVSDVPPGTGLGSSGAYTVAALRTLDLLYGADPASPGEIAERASEIELGVLGRNVGKQDQYASAHGGVNAYTFNPDDSVEVEPLELPEATRAELEDHLLLFYTGGARSASQMLSGQVSGALSGNRAVESSLDRTREIAIETARLLRAGDVVAWAGLLNELWSLKLERSPQGGSPRIEEMRAAALGAGALGALLMGAGGAGFLLVHAPDPPAVREAMAAIAADELPFGLTDRGCATADK
jgi:D-glycero-alpha-D-manno-heptose-7-phosphate kinase